MKLHMDSLTENGQKMCMGKDYERKKKHDF